MKIVKVKFGNVTSDVPVTDEVYQAIFEEGYKSGSLSVREEMITHNEAYQQGRADVLNKLMDIRNDLPFLDADHWSARDDEAITKLFSRYEQLKEQNR